MNNRPLYAHKIADARGKSRSMRVHGPFCAVILAAVMLAGCASGPQPCTTRTEIRRVPQPVFIRVPGEFVEPLAVPELPAELSCRDLEADIQGLEDVIDRCQADRERIRERQQRRAQGEGEP
jgi:outer membrane murein-binding lipoprotein Lpp